LPVDTSFWDDFHGAAHDETGWDKLAGLLDDAAAPASYGATHNEAALKSSQRLPSVHLRHTGFTCEPALSVFLSVGSSDRR
jgi:hypothetical protein